MRAHACSRDHGRFFASSKSSPNAFLRISPTPRVTMSSIASCTLCPLRTLCMSCSPFVQYFRWDRTIEKGTYTLEVARSPAEPLDIRDLLLVKLDVDAALLQLLPHERQCARAVRVGKGDEVERL